MSCRVLELQEFLHIRCEFCSLYNVYVYVTSLSMFAIGIFLRALWNLEKSCGSFDIKIPFYKTLPQNYDKTANMCLLDRAWAHDNEL